MRWHNDVSKQQDTVFPFPCCQRFQDNFNLLPFQEKRFPATNTGRYEIQMIFIMNGIKCHINNYMSRCSGGYPHSGLILCSSSLANLCSTSAACRGDRLFRWRTATMLSEDFELAWKFLAPPQHVPTPRGLLLGDSPRNHAFHVAICQFVQREF